MDMFINRHLKNLKIGMCDVPTDLAYEKESMRLLWHAEQSNVYYEILQ